MGKARSYEIIEYRSEIMTQIYRSKELVKLLGCENEECPQEVIPYNFSFPHEYIPDTINETKRFINYEISATIDTNNNVFKDLTIYFFVVCHEDVIKYKEKNRTYLWYDKVACELDNIFCEKNILGVGKTYLVSNVPYCPQQKFKGRLLKFVVKDFNNGLKYGQ